MDRGDGVWGEHEIDYMLILQGDIPVKPNSNEISNVLYVSRREIDSLLPKLDGPLTPWFKIVYTHWLKLWWDNLHNLEEYKNHKKVLRLS